MLQGQVIVTFNNNFIWDQEEIMIQIRELLMEHCQLDDPDCTFQLSGTWEGRPTVQILSSCNDDEVMCVIELDREGVRQVDAIQPDSLSVNGSDGTDEGSDGTDKENDHGHNKEYAGTA